MSAAAIISCPACGQRNRVPAGVHARCGRCKAPLTEIPVERSSVELDALQKQFRGRRFGELILHHRQKQDLQTTVAALQGVTQELPRRAQPLVESWIDEMNPNARSAEFWRQDCGDALARITAGGAAKLRAAGLEATPEDMFNMFQVIVLNFAYAAHKHPQSKAFIQRALGIGFLRRLFS